MTDDRKDIEELIFELESATTHLKTAMWLLVVSTVVNVAVQIWRVWL